MQLLIVRHAPAEDRESFATSGRPDDERPLTSRGRRRMAENARGLRHLVERLDVLATSPHSRAAETAAILAREYGADGELAVETLVALAPGGRREELLAWLTNRAHEADTQTVAVVGHEPDLGEAVSWLLTGQTAATFVLKKGGACLLDLASPPAAGKAALLWLLTPAMLRELAG